MIKKKSIVLVVVILTIAISTILVYNFYPREQEVIINFSDGSQFVVGRLFSVNYDNKKIDSITIKVNNEEALDTFNPKFVSPLGEITPIKISDNVWSVQSDQLINYSLDEGKYKINMVSNLGTISFYLTLIDNRALEIIFG